jgi:hypothetical protein
MKKLLFIMLFSFLVINCSLAQNLENINFDDFLLDKDLLIGKTITIKGFCRNLFENKYYLYKSNELEDRSRVINLAISDLTEESKEWLSQNCKDGQFITLKAIVEDYDLKVLEIEEANNEQIKTNVYQPRKIPGSVDFDEFMLDKDSFAGKTITISGYCRNNYNDKYYLFKSDDIEDRSKAIRLSTSELSRDSRKWLLDNCKKGVFLTVKAVVEKYDLKVIEIEEVYNGQIHINEDSLNYDDFILDKDSLIGKTVILKGYCRNLYDDKYYLYKSDKFEDRPNAISLSTSNLSREKRKWLLENCKKGKFVIVKAIVEKFGLTALNIEENKVTD